MDSKELIAKLIDKSGMRKYQIADEFGISPAALSGRLNPRKTNSMTVSVLNAMLRKMGYMLVAVPIGRQTGPDSFWVTDGIPPNPDDILFGTASLEPISESVSHKKTPSTNSLNMSSSTGTVTQGDLFKKGKIKLTKISREGGG